MDLVFVIAGLMVLVFVVWKLVFEAPPAPPAPPTAPVAPKPPPVLKSMTVEELSKCDGKDGRPLYVGVNGDVFNMLSHDSGRDLYGPKSPYNVFAGRDATIGLATMETEPSKWTKTVDQLTAAELDVAADWHQRFLMKYELVGKIASEASGPETEKGPEEDADE